MSTVPYWFVVLLAAFWGPVSAKEISDCEGRQLGFSEFTSPDCEYNWLYCDGEFSYFCLDQDCQMEFECIHPTDEDEAATAVTVSDDPQQTQTPPSIYSTPPVLTTTTTTRATTTTMKTRTTTKRPAGQPTNVREICMPGITEYYPYTANCNYFYQCHHGFIYLQQCPMGWQYSSADKRCILVSPYDKRLCQWSLAERSNLRW